MGALVILRLLRGHSRILRLRRHPGLSGLLLSGINRLPRKGNRLARDHRLAGLRKLRSCLSRELLARLPRELLARLAGKSLTRLPGERLPGNGLAGLTRLSWKLLPRLRGKGLAAWLPRERLAGNVRLAGILRNSRARVRNLSRILRRRELLAWILAGILRLPGLPRILRRRFLRLRIRRLDAT